MRKTLIALIVAGLAGGLSAQAYGANRTVRISDDVFGPRSVTVSKGDTVTWRWKRGGTRNQHNVQVRSGPSNFQSALKKSGTYAKKLRKRGTYRIVCSIHQPDMRMTVVVD
jgi:plastocyanin